MTAQWRIIAIIAIIFVTVCFLIYHGSMEWIRIKKVKMLFDDLPNNLNGLNILLITDLHANDENTMNLNIWHEIDKLSYDIAVITGDLTVTRFEQLTPHFNGLRDLAARKPVFFVDGNHDRYYYDKLSSLFDEYNIMVLNNESVFLYDGNLEIIGFRDFTYLEKNGLLDIANDLISDDDKTFKLALFHQPQFYDYIDNKPDLSLCGHTHGGQVRLPFFPTLYAPGQGIFPKYGDGEYDFDGKKMYISRGIGTTVFPIRFFNRPEITVIELAQSDK